MLRYKAVEEGFLNEAPQWNAEYLLREIEDGEEWENLEFPCVPLKELAIESKKSGNPLDVEGENITYIGLENVEPHTGRVVGQVVKEVGAVRSRSKIFEEGDILYGRLRPNLNKVLYIGRGFGSGFCSAEFMVLKADASKIDPLVLRYLLASAPINKRVVSLVGGVTLPRASFKSLQEVSIPLPDKSTQDRIREWLEEVSAERDRLRACLDALDVEVKKAFDTGLKGF